MKVLLLGQDFAISGGVGKYLNRLTHALVAQGHTVGAIQALSLEARPWPPQVGLWTVSNFNAFDERVRPGAVRHVLDIVDHVRPDIVHVHDGSNFALEEELRRKVPIVKTLHTLDFCPAGTRYHYVARRICKHRLGWACLPRIVYKRCTLSKRPGVWLRMVRRTLASRASALGHRVVIVTSQYARDLAVAEGLPASQVHVVPYFTEIPLEVEPPPAHPKILFAARIYPEKGLDLLLRAAALLKPREIAIDVVGDGPGVPAARRLAGDLGILPRVTFHGWQQNMDRFYRGTSVLVVPSRLAEPFGIVGIEAMGHARPAVGFAVGGIPDWLQDGVTGFLVRPYDLAEMASRLGELVDSPETGRRMGLEGRRIATERFTIEVHMARLVALYEQVARA